MTDAPPEAAPRRVIALRVAAWYTAAVVVAHLTGATAVVLVVMSMSVSGAVGGPGLLTARDVAAYAGIVVISGGVRVFSGLRHVRPSFRWFASGLPPTLEQRRTAIRLSHRQVAVQSLIWISGGAVLTLLNVQAGAGVACLVGFASIAGAALTVCTSFLLTQRALRALTAAAMQRPDDELRSPGVLARLLAVWTLFSAMPTLGIALTVLAWRNGWVPGQPTSIAAPVLTLSGISLVLGFVALFVVARSISDPVGELVDAMKAVKQGRFTSSVEVYDPSEIGRLQAGFNDMVMGIVERERLRDVFGRYVGQDVARHALEQPSTLAGDVRNAAMLFVDLESSTAMAASTPPHEFVVVLNDFFNAVICEVEDAHGLINKFGGDSVLALFGAPLRIDGPASAALRAARGLAARLTHMQLNAGIGVSYGPVFAGTVGAENRHEYTVIGDAVNEAARLADEAKTTASRVLGSAAALECAAADERSSWVPAGNALLKGRSAPTALFTPRSNG